MEDEDVEMSGDEGIPSGLRRRRWKRKARRYRHVQDGRCLDSSAWNRGDNDAGDVYTLPCNGTDFQRWYYGWNASAGTAQELHPFGFSVEIRHTRTDRCLDSSNGNVYTIPCQEGRSENQWWHAHSKDAEIRKEVYPPAQFAPKGFPCVHFVKIGNRKICIDQ